MKVAQWAEIRRLSQVDGLSQRAIVSRLRCCHRTVKKALAMEHPSDETNRPARGSLLDPYKPYLLSRWNAGCREALALFAELKGQGYPGSYPTVARYAQRLRQAQGLSARQG